MDSATLGFCYFNNIPIAVRRLDLPTLLLDITARVCFDHYVNPPYTVGLGYVWLFKQDYDGYNFPEEKPEVLELVKQGLEIDESLYMHAEDLVETPI